MKIINILQIALISVLAFGLSSCGQTPAARFYTLSSAESPAVSDDSVSEARYVIGVGPITIAAYLDRPEIVTRSSSTTIKLAAFDRWAEPLESIISSSLAENLASLLPTVRTIIDPWPELTLDYQLRVKIKKFESDESGNIELNASWGLVSRENKKLVAVSESKIIQSGAGTEFDDITKSMSSALFKLSEEIAVELKKRLLD